MTGEVTLSEVLATLDWGTVLVAIISASGAYVAAWLLFRSKAKDDKQTLIDQLQEERTVLKEEGQAYRAKIDAFWKDKAMSRQHVAALRTQIWTRGEPPPVDPPEGYIE